MEVVSTIINYEPSTGPSTYATRARRNSVPTANHHNQNSTKYVLHTSSRWMITVLRPDFRGSLSRHLPAQAWQILGLAPHRQVNGVALCLSPPLSNPDLKSSDSGGKAAVVMSSLHLRRQGLLGNGISDVEYKNTARSHYEQTASFIARSSVQSVVATSNIPLLHSNSLFAINIGIVELLTRSYATIAS